MQLKSYPSNSGTSLFLLYPDVNAPQVAIYCVPNGSITPPTSLSRLINDCTDSSQKITKVQYFFFSSSFTSADCSTILTKIQALKNNSGSFIAWLDYVATETPKEALTGAVKLDLSVVPGSGLPGQGGHMILSDDGPFPLFPAVADSSLNNGINLSQTTSANKFRIRSNSSAEDNCLQLECKSDQATLSFGDGSAQVMSIDNTNGHSSNEYFAAFNIPLVSITPESKTIGPGVLHNANNVTLTIDSVENGPCFSYSLVMNEASGDSEAPASSVLKFPMLKSGTGLQFENSVHPNPSVYTRDL